MEPLERRSRPTHGAFDYGELEQLGMQPETIHDFSVNSNPYGPSPLVHEAIVQTPIERYPDRECLALRRTILQYELSDSALGLEHVLCGNGAAELIWLIARVYLRSGLAAAIVGPTFGEYDAASQAAGATILEYRTHEDDHFALHLEKFIPWLKNVQPALLWLCNPNNPTGNWLSPTEISAILTACVESNTLLVIDEAYWHFLNPRETATATHIINSADSNDHLLVIRSLTKAYALAGARLGYVVASDQHIQHLRSYLPSWNVNAFAQAAGIVALQDQQHMQHTLNLLANESHDFFRSLIANGYTLRPTRTHFCLLAVQEATQLRQHLLHKNILVRDCTSFGLPHYIRIATRPRSEWQDLITALNEIP